jgi:hypothetical protein
MKHILYILAIFCAAFGGAMLTRLPYLGAAALVVGAVCLWAAIKNQS